MAKKETAETATTGQPAVAVVEAAEVTPATQSADETQERSPGKAIIVLQRFRDKTDGKTLFVEGQEVEFDTERANDVVSRGLARFKDGNE
jgi:hypothetical protein